MKNIKKQEIHEIIQRIKHNEKGAIEELYEGYKRLIINISFSIIKNKDISEEITQSIFLKIMQMQVEKLPENNELSWLYTITKNESIDYLRKQKNEISIEEIYDIADNNNSINEIINVDAYNKLIDRLNKKEKEIVSLKILAGLTFDEIGKLLKKPTGTVKWRYYKAIYSLKLALGNLGMAIVAFVIGIKTIKKRQKNSPDTARVIENSSVYNENIDIFEKEETKSANSIISNEADVTNTTINEIVIPHEEVKTNINYLGPSFLGISIILFITTIIFLIQNQLNMRKKTSK